MDLIKLTIKEKLTKTIKLQHKICIKLNNDHHWIIREIQIENWKFPTLKTLEKSFTRFLQKPAHRNI